MDVQFFVQQLALHLTSWEATTFLIGEYTEDEVRENPVFTVADGVVWLSQVAERNSVVRKLQIIKLRGQGSVPGLHTFRITEDGLQAFSRTLGLSLRKGRPAKRPRLSTGIPALDAMMDGGIPLGDSVLVAGLPGREIGVWHPFHCRGGSGAGSRPSWRCSRNAPKTAYGGRRIWGRI
jgi:circadian clock protein KaiC